jgi:hypothetical protein
MRPGSGPGEWNRVSEHDGGAPSTVAATAVHPCFCCVFMILLSGVPGRARLAVCDGPELRHRRSEFIYKIHYVRPWWSSGPSQIADRAWPNTLGKGNFDWPSRRRNKGRDAQLLQPQGPKLHCRALTLGFIHPVSFTRSTPSVSSTRSTDPCLGRRAYWIHGIILGTYHPTL